MPGGALSNPISTVEPVVVMPDIASKKASVYVRLRSENMKGRAPNAAVIIQLIVVSKKACRIPINPDLERFIRMKIPPMKEVKNAETRKTSQSLLAATESTIAGISMEMPSITSRTPIMKKMGR